MTAPGEKVAQRHHDRMLKELAAINKNLAKHGVEPLISLDAAAALMNDNLRKAVRASGDYLIDVAHKLAGY